MPLEEFLQLKQDILHIGGNPSAESTESAVQSFIERERNDGV